MDIKSIERCESNKPRQSRIIKYLLLAIAGYLLVSIQTIPFAGSYWLGEIPILAIWQLPKLAIAGWLRTDVVMPLIKLSGFSSGSFSPDYIMARPYALILSYLIPSLILFGVVVLTGQFRKASRDWFLIVIGLMFVDGIFMMAFGTSPWNGFTMY